MRLRFPVNSQCTYVSSRHSNSRDHLKSRKIGRFSRVTELFPGSALAVNFPESREQVQTVIDLHE
jgi:hypothetical protein